MNRAKAQTPQIPGPVLLSSQRAYQLWAPHYDSSVNPLLALEERLLAPLLTDFAGKDVVDLGCGTGRWLKKLEWLNPRSLTGVDISHAMLEQARMKCGSTTQLLQRDCLETRLGGRSCDCILASFLLSYLSHLRGFAQEAARILRPQGTLFVTDLHPLTATYGWRRTFRAGGTVIEVETHHYSLAQLVEGMREAGFLLVQLAEWQFGADEAAVFERAGKLNSYLRVKSRPVVYWAQFALGQDGE